MMMMMMMMMMSQACTCVRVVGVWWRALICRA
jgi:hypothetical protein